MLSHRFYLSGSTSTGWAIHDAAMGLPLCADKRTPQAALEVAKELKLDLSPQMWDRDAAQWVDLVATLYK